MAPLTKETDRPDTIEYQWPLQGEWTFADYARLPDNGMKYEVIRGELFMSPAPTPRHQLIRGNLHFALKQFLNKERIGEVYDAPIDVILKDLANPVQPDLLVVLNENASIVKDVRLEGVPDLIMEVLSPGSVRHDRHTKYILYAEAGVKEYWIVDPTNCTIEVFGLRGNAYVPLGNYSSGGVARSLLLAGFSIPINKICRRD